MNETSHDIDIACIKCGTKFKHPVIGLDYANPLCPNCGYNVLVDERTASRFRQALDKKEREVEAEDLKRRIDQRPAE